MLSDYEARKLRREVGRELDSTTCVMAKCAAGLVIVALIAVIGVDGAADESAVVEVAKVPAVMAGYEIRPELNRP